MLTLVTILAAAWAADPVDPVLVTEVAPIYPAGALARGERSLVLLELDVRADGSVSDARVVETGGAAFDAAALQAALNFRFTPALDARGEPTVAVIRYRTVFEPGRQPQVSVRGQVRAAGTREEVPGFEVVFEREGQRFVAITGPDGTFALADLAPGEWTVSAPDRGWRLDPVQVTVTEGQLTEVDVRPVLSRPWDSDERGISETVVVQGEELAPEVTERSVSQEEARYLPGTNGDIVRVVQNLPGVARPPLNIGQLIIRGTAPEDSAYYLDGARIPSVFHFSGFATVLVGELINEIGFLPGNYGVRYGRTLGGVVDLKVVNEPPTRDTSYVSVDLFQTTAFVQQRFANTVLSVSGRRSYADTFLNPILGATSDATIRVPRYADLQAHLYGKAGRGTVDALFLLSDDRFSVLGTDADDVEQVTVGLTDTFQKFRLVLRAPIGRGWTHEGLLVAGPDQRVFDFLGEQSYERPFTVGVREELLRQPAGETFGLRTGLDVELGSYRFDYAISQFGPRENADTLRAAPAVYVEPTIEAGPLRVIPGLRADAFLLGSGYRAFALDPRLGSRLELGGTALKASAGGYSQFPTVRQAIEQPALTAQRSWQVSAGLEQRLGSGLQLEVTGFHNWLDDLVSGREDAFRFFSGPPPIGPQDTGAYANDGTGRVAGVEGLLRYADDRTAAWLSMTFSRSTRVDRPGDERALFEYDQPVVLTGLISRELPRRWRVGLRARFSSGNPYTPVVNRFLDLGSQTYVPVYGDLDSARIPPFWSLDTRIDKDFVYRNWTLSTYVDVQNTTNNANVEVIGWTFDYREQDNVTSIPLVPVFGVRGEW
jgi:TonB family protein